MTALAALLRQRIREQGPLTIAEYMACALGDPEHGYYAKRDPLGVSGDFITAPEISQLFGELLAAWCVEVWRNMNAPDSVLLVELGPGRATLVADAWRCWRKIAPEMARAVRLHLVETSPALRARQRAELAQMPVACTTWHAALAEVPKGPALILANEFFDALPVHQYIRRPEGWRERLVGLSPTADAFDHVDGRIVEHHEWGTGRGPLDGAREGDVLELCPVAEALAAEIAMRVAELGGAALIIDYGPAKSALGETLQAVRAHRYADPLSGPGEVDLSHHVDFERLRAAAGCAGGSTYGPVPQGLFLGRLGIADRAAALAATASSAQAEAVRRSVRRLTHPGHMGLLFKALAITHPNMPVPPGFSP